jgi:hypothetical protein
LPGWAGLVGREVGRHERKAGNRGNRT